MTFDGKTYTNDFPFSNGFPFTSRLCQPFERLGHPFARNSPFECPGGYSGFQVTGMIEGFFGFEIFDSRIFLGTKIWQPGLVLVRVIHNVTVETKPFLGVSSTCFSLLK